MAIIISQLLAIIWLLYYIYNYMAIIIITKTIINCYYNHNFTEEKSEAQRGI